jgi:RNA polymerase sigma-70 factor (ECF subfamily)
VNARDTRRAARFVALAYQQHRRELDRYLTRRLRNRQDVRELAQEVWTRLLRVSDATQVQEPLAYIYRAASNVISEFHMRQNREQVSFNAEAPDEASSEDLVEDVSRQCQFERAMGELPKVYRKVVLMKLRDGLSYKDIGRELGLATRTAEQYFYRALALLRGRPER